MALSLVRSVFAVAVCFAPPVFAARLKPSHKAALDLDASAVDSKCCCMAGACAVKNNLEDEKKS